MTKNRGRSIEAHFLDGAGSCSIFVVPIKKPILCLWLFATTHPADYVRYMTMNHWRSVATHFHNLARSVSLSILPIKEVNTSFMTLCNLLPHRQPRIHDQESWMLHWQSSSWWGRERFSASSAYKGSENCDYDYLQPIAHKVTQNTWPRIVDAPLTLILRWVYTQYAIIGFGIAHHSCWVGCFFSIFSYCHHNHCIVD